MRVKGAIFDMDGTVLDSLMFWDVFWERFGEKYLDRKGFKASSEVDSAVRTKIFSQTADYIKEIYGISADSAEIKAFMTELCKYFYQNVASVKKGAVELLEYMKACGIRMCIASATDLELVKFALEAHAIDKYFSHILSSAEIGKGKDVPDIYLAARDMLGFSENEICVFEDSYVAATTAKKAGFKTVGLFDRYNFNQNILKEHSDIYVCEGESMLDLVGRITKGE